MGAYPALTTLTSLEGRTAIVTGGGSGIGAAIARVLAAAGAAVVVADIREPAAQETVGLIVSGGGTAKAAAVDVSRRGDVADLVESVVAEHGRLDVMCNNAGIMVEAPLLDLDEAQLDRALAVNLKGVLFGCQEAGKAMVAARRGTIINTASDIIDGAAPGFAAYSVSKVAVVQVTRTLAVELGPSGVRVNAIAPGVVETGITRRHYGRADGSVDEGKRAALLEKLKAPSPLGLIGTPEDVAWVALYLASDAARFVTGQIMRPNGGTSMPW